ncbi:MAG: peptidase MA family metallohydrolase [Anaerolineae bacterium]
MANWWEKGAFNQPTAPQEGIDRPAVERVTSSTTWVERLGDVDWRSIWIVMALAVVVVAVRGFDLWRGRQLAAEVRRQELRQTIAQELKVRQMGDATAYLPLLDPLASRQWRQQQAEALTTLPFPIPGEDPPIIERWQFRGNTAMVDLRFSGPPATHETRFYRIVADTWRRTPPIAEYWGRRLESDTPGVHFIYREADAEAVEGTIDALRVAFRQGDVPVLSGQRLIVEVVPEDKIEYNSQDNRLLLPSPRLSPRLASVPDSMPILWRLAHPIADRLVDPGNAARYRYLDNTQLLQDHVRYWSLRWQAPFPARWEVQMLNTLRNAADDDGIIVPRAIDMFSVSRSQSYLAYYEVMTMVDYIAEQYGPVALMALDEALTQASSWDSAVPVVLGVDVGEFERDWLAYLDARLQSTQSTTPQSDQTVGG